MTIKVVFWTTTGAQTVPSDFKVFVSVEAIGSGSTVGGGGAYASSTAVTGLTPGQTVYTQAGDGFANPDSWFNSSSNAAPTLISQGVFAAASTGISGALASACVGTTAYSGGDCPNSTTGGGGGAGGPSGAGAAGGSGIITSSGGGGGGSNSGSVGGAGTSTTGGTGGNGQGGSGGGAGGTASTSAVAGTAGTGGGGGGSGTGVGGNGGTGSIWTQTSDSSTAGPGGGGGGSYASRTIRGIGGLYGGGGGTSSNTGTVGIVVFTYNTNVTYNKNTSSSSSSSSGLLKTVSHQALLSSTQSIFKTASPIRQPRASSPQSVLSRLVVGRIFAVGQANIAGLIRQAGKLVSVSSANLASVFSNNIRVILAGVASASSFFLVYIKARIGAVIVSSPQSFSLTKAASKNLSISSPESFFLAKAFITSISYQEFQIVSSIQTFTRTLFVASAASYKMVLGVIKPFSIVFNEAVSLVNKPIKIISTAIFLSAQELKNISLSARISSTQVVQVIFFNIRKVLTQVSSPSAVNLTRATIRFISVTSGQLVSAVKGISHPTSVSDAQSVFSILRTGKPISVAQANVVSFSRAVVRFISLSSLQTVKIIKALSRVTSAVSAQSISALKNAGKIISVVSGEAFSFTLLTAKRISISSAESVKNTFGRFHFLSASAASPQNPRIVKTILHLVSISSSQIINFSRFAVRGISIAQGSAQAAGKAISRTTSVISTQAIFAIGGLMRIFSVQNFQRVSTNFSELSQRRMAIFLGRSSNRS